MSFTLWISVEHEPTFLFIDVHRHFHIDFKDVLAF